MNWEQNEKQWLRVKGNVSEQWDDLTEDQLTTRIQETYAVRDDQAEPELTDWQERLREIRRAS